MGPQRPHSKVGEALAQRAAQDEGRACSACVLGEYFEPESIRAILAKLGADVGAPADAPKYTAVQKERIDLLARFLHKMERRFYVSESDLAKFSTTRVPKWPRLRQLLEKHDLLTTQSVRRAGPHEPLLRLSHPPRMIRAGEDTRDQSRPEVTAFWRELLSSTR